MKRKILIITILSALVLQGTSGFAASLPVAAPATTNTSEPDPAKVRSAVDAFNSLSKKEKKSRIKAVKAEMKKARKSAEPVTNTLLLVIIAILLPPLAVYLHQGEINSKFWISLLLTLLFYVPGLIYSLVVILGDQ